MSRMLANFTSEDEVIGDIDIVADTDHNTVEFRQGGMAVCFDRRDIKRLKHILAGLETTIQIIEAR